MSDLHWTNERRKLRELRPQPDNPRAIRKAEAARLNESLQQFDQFDTIAVGPDGTVYNGHQRVAVWQQEHGGDFEVDVRVASRALTHDEWRKLTALAHTGATGDWDWDKIAAWDAGELQSWGFDAETLARWNENANNLREMLNAEGAPLDYDELWKGMPEFEQETNMGIKSLTVHFATEEDVRSFAELTGQPVTMQTTYIWHPRLERENLKAYKVTDES